VTQLKTNTASWSSSTPYRWKVITTEL